TDDSGQLHFYDREVDRYKQDHFQLHWNRDLGSGWSGNLALHYTRGRGYFEQFREDDPLVDYGLEPFELNGEPVETTDLIRRRWLDNDFYGTLFSVKRDHERTKLIFGGGYTLYRGDH